MVGTGHDRHRPDQRDRLRGADGGPAADAHHTVRGQLGRHLPGRRGNLDRDMLAYVGEAADQPIAERTDQLVDQPLVAVRRDDQDPVATDPVRLSGELAGRTGAENDPPWQCLVSKVSRHS